MAKYRKILFVCTDNTCRSIMAETVMKAINKDPEVEVTSRGLVVLFAEPINPKAVAVMRSHQREADREYSEPLTAADVDDDTLVLTMTVKDRERVKELLPGRENGFTLGEFAGTTAEITQPLGGSLAEYGTCYENIDLLVKMAAERMMKQNDQ